MKTKFYQGLFHVITLGVRVKNLIMTLCTSIGIGEMDMISRFTVILICCI